MVHGRRGGSALCVAAVNALAREDGDLMTGRLLRASGVGPGDPELLTLKAARLIGRADVVAYHSGTHGRSIARSIVADLIPAGVIEELLDYPVTTGATDHPVGYYGAMADFYDDSAARLAAHLDAGRDVVVLAEGDPLFYSSYMYLHDRLADRFALRDRARRHLGQRRRRGRGDAAGPARGRADRAARHAAGARARPPAGRHRGAP